MLDDVDDLTGWPNDDGGKEQAPGDMDPMERNSQVRAADESSGIARLVGSIASGEIVEPDIEQHALTTGVILEILAKAMTVLRFMSHTDEPTTLEEVQSRMDGLEEAYCLGVRDAIESLAEAAARVARMHDERAASLSGLADDVGAEAYRVDDL